jgi:hypothetical protein
MAQQFYNIDIKQATFPMLSEQMGRTIIGQTTSSGSRATEDKPGIAYCQNVMPTARGLDSVGYSAQIPAISSSITMQDVRTAFGDLRNRFYIAWDSAGSVYVLAKGATTWNKLASSPAGFVGVNDITIGTVNGVSYLYYSKVGAFVYNETTQLLESVTLAGLDESEVLGVIGSSGYLVAVTHEAIAWSSTILPTDFVPSDVTGAGGGNVAGTEGEILFITSNSLGLLIYTAANVIAGTYTGNARFPFKFRPVNDAKGGIGLDLVAYEANSTSQYVFSKAGLQAVTSSKADNILPEVTDFLAGKRFEAFDFGTQHYTLTELTNTMLKKIKFVAARYLVISYGITSFTHALVYDTALNKLGKLAVDHVDCFEYLATQDEISKESIAFLGADGCVQTLDFSTNENSLGVLVLGKLQYTRNRFITLLGMEVENVAEDAFFLTYTQESLDGKNFELGGGTQVGNEGGLRTYGFRVTAKNHSIVFLGKFNSITAQIRYSVAGRR